MMTDTPDPSVELVQALLESENLVDRLTAERDAAYACIRRWDAAWDYVFSTDDRAVPNGQFTPEEAEALRRARAGEVTP